MRECELNKDATLMDAIKVIEASMKRLAVVVSGENQVLGTLTDGDVRRGLLNGLTLNTPVTVAMNNFPVVAPMGSTKLLLEKLLSENNIRAIPLVDKDKNYIKVFHEMEFFNNDKKQENEKSFFAAVIMAGGEGTRLRPITEKLPKPMVKVNGIPLLERQVSNLRNIGVIKIYISVNYLRDIIKNHFGDGAAFGVEIHYLDEDKRLGTGGALSLMPEIEKNQSIIVMNGDILTNSDFFNLYDFHKNQDASITMCAVNYHVDIPFGVIDFDGTEVKKLVEKPSQNFFCNAGIYALSSDVMKDIPLNTFWNMTDLIDTCLAKNKKVSVFPLHEYWTDIGTPEDLEKAQKQFNNKLSVL